MNTDPRGDKGFQLGLQRDMMVNFRKQKKEREDDNFVDSEKEEDEGGRNLLLSPSPLLHSYAAPVSLSPHTQPYDHSHCPLPRIACLELLR